jgi:hypothetical protein
MLDTFLAFFLLLLSPPSIFHFGAELVLSF